MTPGDKGNQWGGESQERWLTGLARQPVVVRAGSRDLGDPLRPGAPQGDELGFNLIEYWNALLKHRWLVLGIIAGALAIGLVVTLLTTPIYRATTTIQIEREAAKIVDMQGVEPEATGDRDFYQTQYSLLQSRSLAERVVDRLNLGENPAFMDQQSRGPAGVLRGLLKGPEAARQSASDRAARRNQAVSILTQALRIEPERGSHLVAIHYDSPNPQIAATVSNAVAENFIGSNLNRRFEASSYARKFLEERLAQVKAKLEESERLLVAYAQNQQLVSVGMDAPGGEGAGGADGSQSLTAANLASMNDALAEARQARIAAETRWRQAEATQGMASADLLQSPAIQSLRQSRATLQGEYQEKLSLYKPDYPTMVQLQDQLAELDRQIAGEARTVKGALRAQYEITRRQEAALSQQVAGLSSSVLDLRGRGIRYNIIQREVETNRTLYDGLLQRYKEIGVAGGVGNNNVSIVDRAQPPGSPFKPNLLLNLLTAAGIGLLLGVGGAIGMESLDETMKAPEDVEGKLGVPLLGTIPALEKGVTPEEALSDMRSAFSEAYYSVRTALQFSTSQGVPGNLLITSARPSEGKSTTAVALARNFAKLGISVLLVDADLRNPSLHRVMHQENNAGLSNYLTGRAPLSELAQVTEYPNLAFMPCGPLPPNPAELLAGSSIRRLIDDAAQTFDLMILDGPPVMGLADAPLLASVAAGTVLVIEAGATREGLVKTALRRLGLGNAHVLGALLTKFSVGRFSYGYGDTAYSYDYGVKKIEAQ